MVPVTARSCTAKICCKAERRRFINVEVRTSGLENISKLFRAVKTQKRLISKQKDHSIDDKQDCMSYSLGEIAKS